MHPLVIVAIVVGSLLALCCVGGIVAVAVAPDAAKKGVNDAVAPTSAAPVTVAPTKAGGHTIRFEVTSSTGKATVNWSTLEDAASLNDVPTPWSKEVRLETRTGLVGVTASGNGAHLTCKLIVDGKVVDEGESDSVVNCSASVPA